MWSADKYQDRYQPGKIGNQGNRIKIAKVKEISEENPKPHSKQ